MKSLAFMTALFVLVLCSDGFAAEGGYPDRTIRLVVPFGPGGTADILARIIGQRMQVKLAQPVVVENRPGAGGLIGNEAIANAPADGYTLGVMTAGQVISAVMSKSLRYDPLTAFEPVGQVATASFVIVTRPDFPAGRVAELVGRAKADPGKIVFASPGFGATQHLAVELFKQTARVDMLHVPYRSSPEAMSALLGKQVDVLIDTISAVLGQINGGQVKALAVTGHNRFPALPSVPAAVESGVLPGYDVTSWVGFFGPAGMPSGVVEILSKTLAEIVAEPDMQERLISAGVIVRSSPPKEFGRLMKDELARWGKVRTEAGLPQH